MKTIEEKRAQRAIYNKKNIRKRYLYNKKRRKDKPWINSFDSARQRCNDPNHVAYHSYGGFGIKFLLAMEEIKYLWVRDNAEGMNFPSLDRIDNDGHYEYSNLRFIERSENSSRPKRKKNAGSI